MDRSRAYTLCLAPKLPPRPVGRPLSAVPASAAAASGSVRGGGHGRSGRRYGAERHRGAARLAHLSRPGHS